KINLRVANFSINRPQQLSNKKADHFEHIKSYIKSFILHRLPVLKKADYKEFFHQCQIASRLAVNISWQKINHNKAKYFTNKENFKLQQELNNQYAKQLLSVLTGLNQQPTRYSDSLAFILKKDSKPNKKPIAMFCPRAPIQPDYANLLITFIDNCFEFNQQLEFLQEGELFLPDEEGLIKLSPTWVKACPALVENEASFNRLLDYLSTSNYPIDYLDLSGIDLQGKPMAELWAALAENHSLTMLNLSGCNLNNEDIPNVPAISGLRTLDLSNNNFDSVVITLKLEALNLEHLFLSGNKFDHNDENTLKYFRSLNLKQVAISFESYLAEYLDKYPWLRKSVAYD
ncbi:MAG: hypothetical protein ACK4M7_02015, partial [Burkholderiales bacterium]